VSTRSELAPQREQLQARHQEARSSRADLEQLAGALAEHVSAAKSAAGAEAAAELLAQRAAIRARIREHRAELEQAYTDMAKLNDSVEVKLASYPDHVADVRGPDDRHGPLPAWIEPRREIVERWLDLLGGMVRCQAKAGNDHGLAYEMAGQGEAHERAYLEVLSAGHPQNPNILLRPRQVAANILRQHAERAGEA
jgi:hypothetical protein